MTTNAPVRRLSRISFKSPLRRAARQIITSPTFSTIKGVDFDKKNEYDKFVKFIQSSNKELIKIKIPTPEALKESIGEETNQKSGSRLGDLIKTITGFNVLKWFTRLIRSWWNRSPIGKYINKMTRPWRARLKKFRLDFKKWRLNLGKNIRQGISNFLSKQNQRLKDGFNWIKKLKPMKALKEGLAKIKNFRLSDITKHIKMPKFLSDALTKIRNAGGVVKNFIKNKGGAVINWGKSKTGGLVRSTTNQLKKINPFKNAKLPKGLGLKGKGGKGGGLLTAITLIPTGIEVFNLFKDGRWKDASRLIISTGVSIATFNLIFGASGASAILTAALSGGALTWPAILQFIAGTGFAITGSAIAYDQVDKLLIELGLESDEAKKIRLNLENNMENNNEEEIGDQSSSNVEGDSQKVALITKKEEQNKNITTKKINEKKNLITSSNKKIETNKNLVGKGISKPIEGKSNTSPLLKHSYSIATGKEKILLLIPPENNNVIIKNGKTQLVPFQIGSNKTGGSSIDLNKVNSKILDEFMSVKLELGSVG